MSKYSTPKLIDVQYVLDDEKNLKPTCVSITTTNPEKCEESSVRIVINLSSAGTQITKHLSALHNIFEDLIRASLSHQK